MNTEQLKRLVSFVVYYLIVRDSLDILKRFEDVDDITKTKAVMSALTDKAGIYIEGGKK